MNIFATDDDDEIAQLMEQWFFTKAKEANYAQIAVSRGVRTKHGWGTIPAVLRSLLHC